MSDLTFVHELISKGKRAKAREEIDALRRKIAARQSELGTIRSKLDAAKAQISDHNKRLQDAITCAAELEPTKEFLENSDYEAARAAINQAKESAIESIRSGESAAGEANTELARANDEVRSLIAELRALGDTSYDMPKTLADVKPEIAVQEFKGRHDGEIQKLRDDLSKLDDSAALLWAKDPKIVSLYCNLYAGTARRVLAYTDVTDDERELATRLIKKTHAISAQYGNRFIDALNKNYNADWNTYISNALKELTQRVDTSEACKHFAVVRSQPQAQPSKVLANARARTEVEPEHNGDQELMECIVNSGLLASTTDKRMAIVGGDNRTGLLADWLGDALKLKRARHYEPREFDNVRDSINANGLDLLIILTCFNSHGMERPVVNAAKARGCPIAFLNSTSKAEAVKAIAATLNFGGLDTYQSHS